MKAFISHSFKILFLITIITTVTTCKLGGGSNIDVPGVDGPHVLLNQDNVVISMTIKALEITDELRVNFPKFKYSYVEIKADPLGGAALKFVLSLQDLLGDVTIFDPMYLPGGRNLPGVPSGNLAAVAITIPKLKDTTLYLGKSVFGVFVPVNLKIDNSILTFKHYVKGRRSGNLSLVGRDPAGENAGVLLLLDMRRSTRRYLKKIAKKYNYLH